MIAEQVKARDKTMARLAEVLERHGVEALGYEEASCCRPQRLHWSGLDLALRDMEKLMEDNGYRIARIQLQVYECEKQ